MDVHCFLLTDILLVCKQTAKKGHGNLKVNISAKVVVWKGFHSRTGRYGVIRWNGLPKRVFAGTMKCLFKPDIYVNICRCAKAFTKVEITRIYEVWFTTQSGWYSIFNPHPSPTFPPPRWFARFSWQIAWLWNWRKRKMFSIVCTWMISAWSLLPSYSSATRPRAGTTASTRPVTSTANWSRSPTRIQLRLYRSTDSLMTA